jgi:hypothetical protein
MSRLADSQRNSLIEDFRNGIVNPDFDIIPNKNVKGKYTVRKRKVPLSVRKEGDLPPVEGEQPPVSEEQPLTFEKDETVTDDTYNPFADDELYIPGGGMKQGEMFREMQLQINRMMLEQMKMMRHQQKDQMTKHNKYKEKTKKVYDIINQVANQPPSQDEDVQIQQPKYFKEEPPSQPPEDDEEEFEVQYTNEYERQLDYMTGDSQPSYSRRNNLKAFI